MLHGKDHVHVGKGESTKSHYGAEGGELGGGIRGFG